MIIKDLANSKYVYLLGRHYKNSEYLHLDFSGAGFKTAFIGSKLSVSYEATNTQDENINPFLAILIDGAFYKKIPLVHKKGTLELFSGINKKHIVEVIKLTECPVNHVGYKNLKCDGEFIEEDFAKDKKILIFGDSVTCGFGIDANHETPDFYTKEENYLKSYAYLLSKKLDADVVNVASGGFPVHKSPYSKGYKIDNIPDLLNIASFDINSTLENAPKWDNSKFVPDIIIVNLGANDGAYINSSLDKYNKEEKLNFLKSKLDDFIINLKKSFPFSKIIIMSNLLKLDSCIDKVLDQVGEKNKTYRFISTADSFSKERPAGHPSALMHEYGACELEKFVRSIL